MDKQRGVAHRVGAKFQKFGTATLVVMSLLGSACSVETPSSSKFETPPSSGPVRPTEPAKAPLPPSNPAGTGEKVSVTIDNETGGEVELSDGTKVEVPPGALPPEVDTISVTSSPEPAPSEYQTVSPVFIFEPSGTVFLKPLKVTLPLASKDADTSELTILWSRQRDEGFDMIPTTFLGSGVAEGEVTHFSKGMVAKKYVVDPHPAPDPYAD